MNPELLHFHEQIVHCTRPEDLFGQFVGGIQDQLVALKMLYRKFAFVAHVDRYQRLDEQRIAHLAFTRLNDFNTIAIDRINAGTYGTAKSAPKKDLTPPVLKSRKGTYVVTSSVAAGDVSKIYAGEFDGNKCSIKIAKHHTLNDFLVTEAKNLELLNKAAEGTVSYRKFLPVLQDSFTVKVAPDNAIRQVNVFHAMDGLRSLNDIRAQYPTGVDQRHFIWIFNRLLTVLSFAHSQGIIHGAVLPQHIFVHPIHHSIQMIDWCFSVQKKDRIKAMSQGFEGWYPPEVYDKKGATSATDLYMAAMCMSMIVDDNLHPKFGRLLNTCLIKNQARRQQSAWELFKEVQTISETVVGQRKYVELKMA